MWGKLSRHFFNGLIILLPLFITIWLLWFMFAFIDGILGNIIALIFGRPITGLGFIIALLLTLVTGIVAPYVFGKRIIDWLEDAIAHVPVIKNIYSSAKQINEVLFIQKIKADEETRRRACIVEYPRQGIYSL